MLKPVPYRRASLLLVTLLLGACSSDPSPAREAPDAAASGAGSGGSSASAGASAGGQKAGAGGGGTPNQAGQGGAGSNGTGAGGAGGTPAAGRGGVGGSPTGGQGGTSASSGTGGIMTSGGAGSAGSSGQAGTLPPLHVDGTSIKDPTGKTVVLRGVDVPDLGTLYADGGQSLSGITGRIDKLLAAGLDAHVIRLAVYPRTTFNGGSPFYSPVPFPVGQAAPSGMHAELGADDYITKILRPSVDYVLQKKAYAIIDYHQIDDATGQSGKDAVTFWQSVAPAFASDDHVIFEPFNEPIDTMTPWATFKSTVQTFIDAIRAGAPNQLIVVPNTSWDQHPGDAASSPPTGTNLVYAAHVYPGNWSTSFKQQVATAVAVAPVFFTEWGYVQGGADRNLGTSDANWGSDFRTLVDANGASWSAWVADASWTPNLFSDRGLSSLTPFGTLTADWLGAKATSDWVL